jgi:cellulose synthase/poly-beta-1,6-N-acetylglucosamine synthase-like glycosyltransferase
MEISFYTVFRLVFFLLFTGLHLALMGGLWREWKWNRRLFLGKAAQPNAHSVAPPDAPPLVSVIVPFRNEERRMAPLLKTLALQDYPNLEYIFIDDRSDDGGPALLEDFVRQNKRTLVITLKENPGENPKQFAIEKGVEAAGGSFFLFTDADCEVPPGWAASMLEAARESKTGIVIGPVFKKRSGRLSHAFFSSYQCFDHAVRYLYLMAATGLGSPGGGFGNNLLLKKEALEAVGGYRAVPPSPTEDASLIALVRSRRAFRVRAASARALWVMTEPESSWKPFLGQTLRWNNGGLFSPDKTTRFTFTVLMAAITLGMLALPLLPFVPSLWPLSLAVLLSMGLNTVAVHALFGGALSGMGIFYIVHWIFTPMYFSLLTVLGLFGVKVTWKGKKINR